MTMTQQVSIKWVGFEIEVFPPDLVVWLLIYKHACWCVSNHGCFARGMMLMVMVSSRSRRWRRWFYVTFREIFEVGIRDDVVCVFIQQRIILYWRYHALLNGCNWISDDSLGENIHDAAWEKIPLWQLQREALRLRHWSRLDFSIATQGTKV